MRFDPGLCFGSDFALVGVVQPYEMVINGNLNLAGFQNPVQWDDSDRWRGVHVRSDHRACCAIHSTLSCSAGDQRVE